MINILYVIDSLAGGGAEKLLNDILPLEDEFNAQLLIVISENDIYKESIENKGIEVHVVPEHIKSHPRIIGYIINFIKASKFDIVHANLFPVTYYCSVAKRMNKKNFPILIMTEHSTDNKRRHHKSLRVIEKRIYRSYDKIIAISNGTKKGLIDWLGYKEIGRKCIVIKNGIEWKTFYYAQPYERTQLFRRIAEDDILICMIGSLKALKNHSLMLEVLADLPLRYKLLIVGEGSLRKNLEEEAYDKGLNDRIVFTGFRRDIPQIMHTVDIVVVPSRWEGFGLTAVEAMACGTPVVVSDVPGLSEVVGESGLKAKNREDYVRCILLLENRQFYDKVCTDFIEFSKKFNIENTRTQYEQLYRELVVDASD